MANDYLDAFARESEEQITRLNNALLDFENDPSDESAMEDIFRTAHTLKGNCGAMGFDPAEELAHAIEDLLESIRSNRVPVTAEVMDAVFDGVDELEAMIGEAVSEGAIDREAEDVIAALREHASADGLAAPADGEIDALLSEASPPADSEYSVYHVRLTVAGDPAVHGRAVVDALDDAFDLLATDPDGETVDAGEYDGTLDAAFASVVETAAVEAALQPVDAVADQVITEVTDRIESESAADAADAQAGSASAAEAPAADGQETDDADGEALAADVSVDELLQDEDVDQFDDLDEMAEEIEDASEFDDLGDAGSFADLGISEDDLEVETGSESESADAADASADDEEVADATADDQVDDAAATFAELQEEVDPVGFDELQDELAELEFDEYDTDEEVGFEELLGEDGLAEEEQPEEDLADATQPEVDASEAAASDDGAATAVDAGGTDDPADETADAVLDDADTEPEAAELDSTSSTEEVDATASHDHADSSTAADPDDASPADPDPRTAQAEAGSPSDRRDATAEDLFGGGSAGPGGSDGDDPADAPDEAADASDPDPAVDAESDSDPVDPAVEAVDGPDASPEDSLEESVTDSADAASEDGADVSSEDHTEVAPGDDAGTFGEEDLDLSGVDDAAEDRESTAPEELAADDELTADEEPTAEDAAADAAAIDFGDEDIGLDEEDVDFGEGTVPAAEPEESNEADAPVGTGDVLEDDSFGDVEATDDGGDLDDDVADEAVEGFGERSVLDLDDESAADATAPTSSDVGESVADPSDEDLAVEGDVDAETPESETLDDATVDDRPLDDAADATLEDPGFNDAPETGADDGPEVDEDRIQRIRSLGVPERGGDDGSDVAAGQTIRVDVQQLDRMLNLVEGLVTSRARLRRALLENEAREVLEEELDDLEDVTSELQDSVMDVRLVPLRTAVNKLPRTVRDVAREEDKRVDFRMEGEDVEIDRSILDEIGDPLVHLVRNAVDHGIESPEEREAAGKPEEGSVVLRAVRERDRVRITVEDDGRGIDADQVRDAAVAEGIHTRSEVEELSDDEVTDLIFHAGFSTAEEVTDVSGRGVGMDVVSETVDRLDGSVRVDSELGEGTTIEMELPVSLAIAEVLFVEVGGEEYGIPIKVVDEIGPVIDVETQDGQEVLVSDGGEDRRELLRLDDELGTPGQSDPKRGMLIHLRDEVREAAIHCDEVREQQEVVVKPFEGVLGDVPGLGGATVLGDGDVVNILDVETL